MAKTKIKSVNLAALFVERLKQCSECPAGIIIAIVSNTNGAGWEVATNRLQRKRHPLCAKRIKAIKKQLRTVYVLVED